RLGRLRVLRRPRADRNGLRRPRGGRGLRAPPASPSRAAAARQRGRGRRPRPGGPVPGGGEGTARLSAMSVRGLFETHMTVADLKRSVAFYRDTVGLPVGLKVPERES